MPSPTEISVQQLVRLVGVPDQPVISIELIPRPAFANYQRWIKEQGIEHVAAQFQSDLPLVAGEANVVRLRVVNAASRPSLGTLNIAAPPSWIVQPTSRPITISGNSAETIELRVTPPAGVRGDGELTASFQSPDLKVERQTKLHPLPRVVVPRVKVRPALDGDERGWEKSVTLNITSINLVQGKVADDADSSALVRLAHDAKTLFIDVQVKDDVVVTNIEPNDIKGHWRADSVEICLDPAAGAEHTMGCYKLGIFPFDTTGVVRAARDADANQGPIEETAPKTRISSVRTTDGYRIQAAIPFGEIGLKRGQRRLGFNVIIYDGDKRDAARGENINKSRLAWVPRSGVQGRPEDWGRIDLE